MKRIKLICPSNSNEYSIERVYPRDDITNEPLQLENINTGNIQENPGLNQTILERYIDFMPFQKDELDLNLSLGEGFTPLTLSQTLTELLNVKNLYLKNEIVNPTWSFKDRGTITGIQHAKILGYDKIGTVSTGNMAVSVAAYGARAGLKTYILVADNVPEEKLKPIAIYNPILIKVVGDHGSLYFKSLEIGKELGIYFINSDVPFRVEGSKTIAFEICEQLNFNIPDFVVVPTSAGGNIRGIIKGFEEFLSVGLINKMPKFVCAQASGCSPIFNAFERKEYKIARVDNPNTIAHAIENPFPPSGNEVLRKLKDNNSYAVGISDEEMLKYQFFLAKHTGIFAQPDSAASLAAVKQLRDQNIINQESSVVCIITGGGLKYTQVLEKQDLKIHTSSLDGLKNMIERT